MPLALLVSGCGSDDDGDESSGAGTTADDGAGATEPATIDDGGDEDPLLGRTMVATSITEGGEDHPLVEGTVVRISVAEDSFSANAGCNTLVGGYTLTGDQLAVGEMGATMMGCDAPPGHPGPVAGGGAGPTRGGRGRR